MKALRLAVYCDFSYRLADDSVYAEVSFSRFVEGLAPHCERLVVLGRLDPAPEHFADRLRAAEFVALPNYRSGADLSRGAAGDPGRGPPGLAGPWMTLDVVWILGPNPPQAPLFAILAMLRGRRVVLGVRQNLPGVDPPSPSRKT